MQPVTLYTTRLCGYCRAAKQLLAQRGLRFREIPVDGDAAMRAELQRRTGQHTVPQIWIGETHVGGFSELSALARSDQLDTLVAQAGGNPAETPTNNPTISDSPNRE